MPMIWRATTGAAGGGCWAGAPAPGRTRRGARPSAAAAARACPCTCPCRRACWSPRSTTPWRGAASAATASTCRDHRPPPHAASAPRPAAHVGGLGRTSGGKNKMRHAASAARAGRRAYAPTYVRTVPYRGAHRQCTCMAVSDRHGWCWSDGCTWWATVAGQGRAGLHVWPWTVLLCPGGVWTWCGSTGAMDLPEAVAQAGSSRRRLGLFA